MRILRPAAIALGAALLLAGAVIVPLAAVPPPGPLEPKPVPAELAGMLYEECIGELAAADDEFLAPALDAESHVVVTLGRIDSDGTMIPSVLDEAQRTEIAGYNACLASYAIDIRYHGDPILTGGDQLRHYDYLARVVVPCLTTFGAETELPSRAAFEQASMLEWYLRQLEQLGFADAVEAWWACPLVPESLVAVAYPENVPQGG